MKPQNKENQRSKRGTAFAPPMTRNELDGLTGKVISICIGVLIVMYGLYVLGL